MVDEAYMEQARKRREGMESRHLVLRADGNESSFDESTVKSERDPLLKAFLKRELLTI